MSNINQYPSYSLGSISGYVEPTVYERDNLAYDVITYGRRNTYPQEVEYALSRSAIAKACTQTFAEFLYGDGFADETTATAIVNNEGGTMNDLLWLACQQFAKFKGFSLFLNCNLAGDYTSIDAFPFTFVRKGLENEEGESTHFRIWDNWAGESPRPYSTIGDIYSIDIFNPALIQEQIDLCGGIEYYNGQLMYFSDNDNGYPACSFDSAFEEVLANGNISEFTNNYIRNGFSNSGVIVNKSIELDDDGFTDRMANIRSLSGIRNAGKIGYAEGDLSFMDISPTQSLDKQYSEINKSLKDDIREAFQQPSILHGSSRQGGFANQDEMSQAYKYYNAKTRMFRGMISKQFRKIADNFVYFVGSDFSIKETSFE